MQHLATPDVAQNLARLGKVRVLKKPGWDTERVEQSAGPNRCRETGLGKQESPEDKPVSMMGHHTHTWGRLGSK